MAGKKLLDMALDVARAAGTGKSVKAFHAAPAQFEKYDWSKLGQNTLENQASDPNWAMNLAKIGPWAHESDIAHKIGQNYSMPVELTGRPSSFNSLDALEAAVAKAGGPDVFRQSLLDKGYGHIAVKDEEFGGKSYIGLSPETFSILKKSHGGLVDAALNITNPVSVFPKPQRMFPADQPVPGGQYVNAKTKEDMTGHKAAAASIGVLPGGKPYFNASEDAVDETGTPGRGSAMAKTNLFKQKAGWKWSKAPEGHEDTNTIVSVEHRGDHHYALNAHFPKGVDLARYEKKSDEPRLRPTTRGNLTKGKQVGTISVRGREHPVYDHVIIKADGGLVDAALNIARQHKVT